MIVSIMSICYKKPKPNVGRCDAADAVPMDAASYNAVVFNQWSGDHQWSLRGFQVVPS